jgi:hypothetical protein
MNKRVEIEKYGLHSYDDFLCLRPPWLLIACSIFLCRGLVLFAGFGIAGGVPAALNDLVDGDALYLGGLAAAPAVLVVYAMTARAPAAPAFVRWSWRHGRALMSVSALAYIALAAAQLGIDPRRWLGSGSALAKAMVLAELGIIGYVLLSSRVRQAFLDFPSA